MEIKSLKQMAVIYLIKGGYKMTWIINIRPTEYKFMSEPAKDFFIKQIEELNLNYSEVKK